MKNLKIFSLFLILTISFSSCKNLVPYTDAIKKQHKWSETDLLHIQFYLSHEIVLTRVLETDATDKIQGKIVTSNGVRTETIYLKKHLKCSYYGLSETGTYLIQCQTGFGNTLTFGVNPQQDNQYVLLAEKWQDGVGTVHYNGVKFGTSTNCGKTALLIDLRRAINSERQYTKLKGVKVQ